MKTMRLMIGSLLLLASVNAFSETKDTSLTTTERGTRRSDTSVDVGLGLAIFNGSTGWNIAAGALQKVSTDLPLYAGLDLGLSFWNFSAANNILQSKATGVHLLPTVIYGLEIPRVQEVHPYIGASVGPAVYIAENTTAAGRVSDTSVFLEALLRPGVTIDLWRNIDLNVETKLGVLRSDFIFMPQVSAVMPL